MTTFSQQTQIKKVKVLLSGTLAKLDQCFLTLENSHLTVYLLKKSNEDVFLSY